MVEQNLHVCIWGMMHIYFQYWMFSDKVKEISSNKPTVFAVFSRASAIIDIQNIFFSKNFVQYANISHTIFVILFQPFELFAPNTIPESVCCQCLFGKLYKGTKFGFNLVCILFGVIYIQYHIPCDINGRL